MRNLRDEAEVLGVVEPVLHEQGEEVERFQERQA